MTLSLDTHFLNGAGTPSGVSPVNAGRKGNHARLHKHRRRTSNASSNTTATISPSATTSPVITAFPTFDPTYENPSAAITYADHVPPDPMPLFKDRRGSERPWHSHQHNSSFSKKLIPLVRHSSDKEYKSQIDLNLSKAENEERGAYITLESSQIAVHRSQQPTRTSHARTISGTSQISSYSTHSAHRGGAGSTYIHPARQVPHPPQSPTPPIPAASTFEIPPTPPPPHPHMIHSTPSRTSLADIPSLPPPATYRSSAVAHGHPSALRSNTSTPTIPTVSSTPALASAPATARSSLDSSFRDRLPFANRTRTNTFGAASAKTAAAATGGEAAPLDPEDQARAVQALRNEWNAREAVKEEKYRRKEARKEQRRRNNNNTTATAAHGRGRGGSGGTVNTVDTVNTLATDGNGNSSGAARSSDRRPNSKGRTDTRTRSRRGSSATHYGGGVGGPGRPSVDQLSAIGYASTTELARPTILRGSSREEVNGGGGGGGGGGDVPEGDYYDGSEKKIPKRQKTATPGSAAKATQSRWMSFWFRLKTAWMRMTGTGGRREEGTKRRGR